MQKLKISDKRLKELAELEGDYEISAGPEVMMVSSRKAVARKTPLIDQDDLLDTLKVKKLLNLPSKKITVSSKVSIYNAQIFDYQDHQVILISDGSTIVNKSHKHLANCFDSIATEIDRIIPDHENRIWIHEDKGVLYQVSLKNNRRLGFYHAKRIPLNKPKRNE